MSVVVSELSVFGLTIKDTGWVSIEKDSLLLQAIVAASGTQSCGELVFYQRSGAYVLVMAEGQPTLTYQSQRVRKDGVRGVE